MSLFAFNAQAALDAGASNFLQEGGAYVAAIKEVKIQHGQNGSQAQSLEFTLETPEGAANWVRVNYQKRDGTISPFGYNLLCAMAALIGSRNGRPVKQGDDLELHHFQGQTVGLVLQKVLYTKQGGGDAYKFEILRAFDPATRKTWSEAKDPAKPEASAIDRIVSTLTVKDDRQKQQTQQQATGQGHQGGYTQAPAAFDDDIPF